MKNKQLICISETPEGKLETKVFLENGLDTIKLGIALASATRVISAAFVDSLKLDKSHILPIQKQISKFYMDDLFKFGSMGEEDNTKVFDMKK